jgi:DNA repair exonuclease SbcCD nuclease subunit
MVGFLHLADIHLLARFTRFPDEATRRLREARYQALEGVRERLRAEPGRVKFVLIAGDLFDDGQIKPDYATRIFGFLSSFPVPVLVIPGNHDPYEPGAIWHSDPWRTARVELPKDDQEASSERAAPSATSSHEVASAGTVRLLVDRVPVRFSDLPGVTFFPCPVFQKTSYDDPSAWIAQYPRCEGDGIRIGIGHGSVMDRPNLPEDDHPIPVGAATALDLDYLALGHWHNPLTYSDSAGHVRMAYTGVHEPMRFPSGDQSGGGWSPYSSGGAEQFVDRGPGTGYFVSIAAAHAGTTVETWSVGYFHWVVLHRAVGSIDDLRRVVDEVGSLKDPGRTLLRLTLSGSLPLESLSELDALDRIRDRFVHAEIDNQLVVEPTESELNTLLGHGVVGRVYRQLRDEAAANGPESRVAREAIQQLYQLSREAGA